MNSAALHDCLRRLMPHVDADRIALTGGVAIGVHLDVRSRVTTAEDIDFVADNVDVVNPTVTKDFLVSHFHLPQPGYSKFLIQLVDPATRIRVDVFPDSLGALKRTRSADVAGIPLRVISASDTLDHKLALLSKSPVDEKHYRDATRLGAICGREVPALDATQLTRTVYSQEVDAICPRCEASRRPDFPLARKQAIFDVLGYV
jgi:hypothetical protein